MNPDTWLMFCGAALLVILVPGPLSLLMVRNSLDHGILRSAPAFAGGVCASLTLLVASASGLGALLLASELLFTLIRYAGALYLIYLGYCAWSDARADAPPAGEQNRATPSTLSMFRRAFGLGISNPKDLLFFVAFLPQFIDPTRGFTQQLVVMVVSWCLLDLACKLAYGSGARLFAPLLRRGAARTGFNRLCGGLFMTAGATVLLK